jgi:hypothetical protein
MAIRRLEVSLNPYQVELLEQLLPHIPNRSLPPFIKSGYIFKNGTLPVKGTVKQDFLTPVFFTKGLILVSIDMP